MNSILQILFNYLFSIYLYYKKEIYFFWKKGVSLLLFLFFIYYFFYIYLEIYKYLPIYIWPLESFYFIVCWIAVVFHNFASFNSILEDYVWDKKSSIWLRFLNFLIHLKLIILVFFFI